MKNIFLYITLAILFYNCNNKEKNWQEVVNADRLSQYQNFIKSNPNSVHLKDAHRRIFEIKSDKILEKYFTGLQADSITGIYDVNMEYDDTTTHSPELRRIDFLENPRNIFALYMTKNTNFHDIGGLNIGKLYLAKGKRVYPKNISVDSLNRSANLLSRQIRSVISKTSSTGKQYINPDSMHVLYKSYNRLSPGLFDTLCLIKEMDDELEIVFHYYKIKNESPRSLKGKDLKNMVVRELVMIEN